MGRNFLPQPPACTHPIGRVKKFLQNIWPLEYGCLNLIKFRALPSQMLKMDKYGNAQMRIKRVLRIKPVFFAQIDREPVQHPSVAHSTQRHACLNPSFARLIRRPRRARRLPPLLLYLLSILCQAGLGLRSHGRLCVFVTLALGRARLHRSSLQSWRKTSSAVIFCISRRLCWTGELIC